ncbi:hypothetical protein ACVWYH_008023 [Bradyrhizobium sp. GM24.11]|jgi:hypothetical protein
MRIEIVWEPIYHIGGAQLLALPMIRDVSLAMVDRFSASRFWSQVKEEGASHIHYLGRILQILLEQSPSPLDRSHGVRLLLDLQLDQDDGRDRRDMILLTQNGGVAGDRSLLFQPCHAPLRGRAGHAKRLGDIGDRRPRICNQNVEEILVFPGIRRPRLYNSPK